MRRREFVTLLGGAAAAWSRAAFAQEPGRTYRLGLLSLGGRQSPQILAFFDELRLLGFVQGQNLVVLSGGFDVPIEQVSARAVAIVKSSPDVLLGIGDLAMRALQAATQVIPIVGGAEDMVAAGLVASLSRPGGNITGVSMLSHQLDGKRQDILIEAVPRRRIAALVDATQTPQSHIKALEDAAQVRGVDLLVFGITQTVAIPRAMNEAKASGAGALNVLASPLLFAHRQVIIEHAAALRLPAIYQWAEAAEEGGFIAYGPRLNTLYRQRAQIVVKLLRGAKPADIPVEQPTHMELVINLKTARAIGYEVPAGLVLRADRVIE